jgi:predicted small metal-binding protein
MRWHAKRIKLANSGGAEGGYMRALVCDCGQHLEASDDQKLFDEAQKHMNRGHPEMQLSAERAREIVTEKAYDKKPDLLAGIDIPPRAAAFMGGGGMPPSSTRPELRQEPQDSVQANEEQEGKKGLVDKIKGKLKGQEEKSDDNKAQAV